MLPRPEPALALALGRCWRPHGRTFAHDQREQHAAVLQAQRLSVPRLAPVVRIAGEAVVRERTHKRGGRAWQACHHTVTNCAGNRLKRTYTSEASFVTKGYVSALVWTGRRVLHLTQCAWVPGYYAYTVLCSVEGGCPSGTKESSGCGPTGLRHTSTAG